MKRVLVATPTKSGITTYWFKAYDTVMQNPIPGYDINFAIEDANQAINLARNVIANAAVQQGYDDLVMIDVDHPWTRAHLERILSHDAPIVSGLYCKKAPGNPHWLGLLGKDSPDVRPDGLRQVDYVPTGFLRIRVSVLKDMQKHFPERRYVHTDDNGKDHESWELFPIGLVGPNTAEAKLHLIAHAVAQHGAEGNRMSGFRKIAALVGEQHPEPARLLGEDYFFSHLARKAGFKLFIDTQCIVQHMGQIPFPITPDMLPTKPTGLQVADGDLSRY